MILPRVRDTCCLFTDPDMLCQCLELQESAYATDIPLLKLWKLLKLLQSGEKCTAVHGFPSIFLAIRKFGVRQAARTFAFVFSGSSISTSSVDIWSPRSIFTLTLSRSIWICLAMTARISSRNTATRSECSCDALSWASRTCNRSRACGAEAGLLKKRNRLMPLSFRKVYPEGRAFRMEQSSALLHRQGGGLRRGKPMQA